MTAREKAEQLFTKFADIEHLGVYGDYNGTWEWSSSLWRQQAKESALIAIEFAIEFAGGDMNEQFDKILYLVEVKHEIENL